MAYIETIHQVGDVVAQSGIMAPGDRIVALRHVDCDLVDNGAGPAAHDKNAVGQRHGLRQIMGDQERGLAGLLEGQCEVALQHHAGLGIDCRKRLVEQKHMRIDRKRTRQRDPLAHAARQLVGIMIGKFRELEVFEQRMRAAPALGKRQVLNLDPEHDVLGDSAPGQAADPFAA